MRTKTFFDKIILILGEYSCLNQESDRVLKQIFSCWRKDFAFIEHSRVQKRNHQNYTKYTLPYVIKRYYFNNLSSLYPQIIKPVSCSRVTTKPVCRLIDSLSSVWWITLESMDRPTLLPASLRWNLDYGFKSRRGGDELTANLQIMKQNKKLII